MGIKNFFKFVDKYEINMIQNIKCNQYKCIAIDAFLFIYRFILAIRKSGKDLTDDDGNIISHLIGLVNMIRFFQKCGVDMIFVFDGKPNYLKLETLEKRKKIRELAKEKYEKNPSISNFKKQFKITSNVIDSSIELLTYGGIKYIKSENEADVICAKLYNDDVCDAVYSKDTDLLLFGVNKLIYSINYKKMEFEIILLDKILKASKLSQKQFIYFSLFSGTDYCPKLSNSMSENIKLAKKIKKLDDLSIPEKDKNRYKKCYEIYIDKNIEYTITHHIKNDELLKSFLRKCNINKSI